MLNTFARSNPVRFFLLSLTALAFAARAQTFELKQDDPYFEPFHPTPAPPIAGLMLKKGDRLAICGDSITEQKMYSRIMETYLTVCVPQFEVTVRQYGWSGERAPGFLHRMTNDCLRFKPTIATTCYGMNDHEYRTYEPRIGDTYRQNSIAIVRAFKSAGARVVQGSAGCVGKVPGWTKSDAYKLLDLNLNLCNLRNIGIEIAKEENVAFADLFWPMLVSDFRAHKDYGVNFAVPGKDGVHPGWAGQVVMAYAFLKSLGLDGEVGQFTVNLSASKPGTVSAGHQMTSQFVSPAGEVTLEIQSTRYPFCAPAADISRDDNIRAGMALVPFNQDLNRFMLTVKNAKAANYKVTWGTTSKTFTADQLAAGINLPIEFAVNPFSDAFAKVDAAVAAKQAYETRQIKELFHGPEGKAEPNATSDLTEKVRAPLATAIHKSFVPVRHTIVITPQ